MSNRRGQSIVEYLIISLAIIGVIVGLTGSIRGAAQNVMNRANGQLVNPSASADSIIPRIR